MYCQLWLVTVTIKGHRQFQENCLKHRTLDRGPTTQESCRKSLPPYLSEDDTEQSPLGNLQWGHNVREKQMLFFFWATEILGCYHSNLTLLTDAQDDSCHQAQSCQSRSKHGNGTRLAPICFLLLSTFKYFYLIIFGEPNLNSYILFDRTMQWWSSSIRILTEVLPLAPLNP